MCERTDSLITTITSHLLPHTSNGSISSTNHRSITSAICLIRLSPSFVFHYHPSTTFIRPPPSSVCHHYSSVIIIRLPSSFVCYQHLFATVRRLPPSLACHHHSPAVITRLPSSSVWHHHPSPTIIRRAPRPSVTSRVYHIIRLSTHTPTTSSVSRSPVIHFIMCIV